MRDYSNEEKTEWERRLRILQDQLRNGKIHFAPHLINSAKESLSAVKSGLDGKIDLSTVDSRVRCLALAVTAMKDRNDLKKTISLSEIQKNYFEWIEKHFGGYYQKMVEKKMTPDQVGHAISKNIEMVDSFATVLPDFMEVLTAFWSNALEPASIHLEDNHKLKAIFGGDLFPSANANLASKCGLYTDTIVLCDPFLKTGPLFEKFSKEKRVNYFVKHALNVLQYKSLALADIDPPIVVILPERFILEPDERDIVSRLATDDSLIHASILFNRKFDSFDDLLDYIQPFDTPDKLAKALTNPERLLFDSEWSGSPEEKIARNLGEDHTRAIGIDHAGKMLAFTTYGRMSQVNDLLLKSFRLRGTPLIDAPTSWQYFNWKLEYDTQRLTSSDITHLHIVRGLQAAADQEMQWLGKVPSNALIEIRKQGALEEIRKILGEGIEQLTTANPNNFYRTRDQITDNIHKAFKEHNKKIKDLSNKKWRFAGIDLGSCVVVGTLAVAGAITGNPLLGVMAWGANEALDPPKLKDLPNKIKALQEESQKIKRSPVGMLFKYGQI